MRLNDNEYITESVAKQLDKDGWTMEKLATAKPSNLKKYKGVGAVRAARIIDEAQRLVNESKLYESAVFEQAPPQEQIGTSEPPMSARVRRIKELNQ